MEEEEVKEKEETDDEAAVEEEEEEKKPKTKKVRSLTSKKNNFFQQCSLNHSIAAVSRVTRYMGCCLVAVILSKLLNYCFSRSVVYCLSCTFEKEMYNSVKTKKPSNIYSPLMHVLQSDC